MPDLTIKDLSPRQLETITAALAGAGVPYSTTEVFYTVGEAQALLEELAPRQRALVVKVAAWDGVLPDEELRTLGGGLRGIAGPITKAVKRLVADGTLRPGQSNPVHPVYDPTNRAFQRVRAYRMDSSDVIAFKAAASTLS